MSSSSTLPPATTPPPAPDIFSLYGDRGGLVAAPPAKPAPVVPPHTILDRIHDFSTMPSDQYDKKYAADDKAVTDTVNGIIQHIVPFAKEANTLDEGLKKTKLGKQLIDFANDQLAHPEQLAMGGEFGGETVPEDVMKGAAATGKKVLETVKTAGESAAHEIEGAITAKAPAGSAEAGKIDLSSVGDKPVARPEPEIQAEGPDWDRTHSAILNGRKVGSVGMKIDTQGRAQIYGSVVNPELRGQGIGQKLYQSAIDDARTQGADRITSDSTNTSPDANRVWEKLKENGEPVEEITHPNGKPGYQIDFTGNAPETLLTSERQSPLKAGDEAARARREAMKKGTSGLSNPGKK
jgi:ribosomal protein S18 acetylase RimI-like enzyme